MILKSLNPQQEVMMTTIRQKWLDKLFKISSIDIDKDKCKKGIDFIYQLSNLNPPEILYVDSPIACQYAANIISYLCKDKSPLANVGANVGANVRGNVGADVRGNVVDNVRNTVEDNVEANVWANVRANVEANVRANVEANVRDNVVDNVWDNVDANVRGNICDNVRDNVWANVRDNVRDNIVANIVDNVRNTVEDNVEDNIMANVWANVWANVRGNIRANIRANKLEYYNFSVYGNVSDYGWLSFYDYFREIGILKNENLSKFISLLDSNIYDMIQFDGLAIICKKPNKIKRNQNNLLHCIDGPAIQWDDGYCQYYINGRNIPDKIFIQCLNNEVSKEQFITEENAEYKAAYYAILGKEKTLSLLRAEEVNRGIFHHNNGEEEEVVLYKTKELFPEAGNKPLAWVKFICPSTSTEYLIDVQPHFSDAKKAAISTSPLGIMTEEEYKWDQRS